MPRGPSASRAPDGAARACGRCSPCSARGSSRWSAPCCCGWAGCSSAASRTPSPPFRRAAGCASAGSSCLPSRSAPRSGTRCRRRCCAAGLIAFPLVVLAAGVVSWWLVGRVLGPLHAVTATARRLSVESLDTRLALRDARGEVAELAAGFDAMLDRLQAAFDAQRRFVANASHELRTPLAVLRTEVDVTLADPDADVAELRRMGEVVRDATRRADELIAGLLLLARSEAPSAVDPASVRAVDLADVVVPALAATRAEAMRRGLRVSEHRAPAPTVGDPVLLERVAGNLVENAVRHNVAGGLRGDLHGAARAGRGAARQSPGDRRSLRSGWRSCSSRSGADRSTARPTRRAPGWGSRSSGRWCSPTAGRWRPNRYRAGAWRSPCTSRHAPGRATNLRRGGARPSGRPRWSAPQPRESVRTARECHVRGRERAAAGGRSGDGAGQVREQRGDQADLPLAGAALRAAPRRRRRPRAGTSRRAAGGRAAAGSPPGSTTARRQRRDAGAGGRRGGRPRPGRGRPSARRAGGPRSGPTPAGSASASRRARLRQRRVPVGGEPALRAAAEHRAARPAPPARSGAATAASTIAASGSTRPGAMSRSAASRSRASHSARTTASARGLRILWMPDVRRHGSARGVGRPRACGPPRTPAAPTPACPARPAAPARTSRSSTSTSTSSAA